VFLQYSIHFLRSLETRPLILLRSVPFTRESIGFVFEGMLETFAGMWLCLFKAESSSKDLLDRDVARWKMKRCRGWQSYSVWWGDDPIEPCYLLVCQDSFRTVWRRTYILSWNRDRISLVPGLVRHCIKCCITKLIHQLLRRLIVAIKYCRDEIGNADNRSFASSPDICVWRRSRTGQIAFRLANNFVWKKSNSATDISLPASFLRP